MPEPLDVKLRTIFHSILAVAKATLAPHAYAEFVASLMLPQKQKPRRLPRCCIQCHRVFDGRGLKYCSPLCTSNARLKPARHRVCPQCQQSFTSKTKRKYCDQCSQNLQALRIPKPCAVCGVVFTATQRAQKFCTKVCKQQWFNKNKVKDRVRRQYLDAVGHCEYCACSERRSLHTHHINGQQSSELMVLCANCHYKYHHIMGKTAFAETRTRTDVLQVLRTGDAVAALELSVVKK